MKKSNLIKMMVALSITLSTLGGNLAFAKTVKGYTAINDNNLAKQFAPSFIIDKAEYEKPIALYYRMSKDAKGNTYIAYHPTWEKEVNNAEGLLPYINRVIYTGGLSLQRYIFGKGDIESIEVVLNSDKKISKLSFETAENYSDNAATVTHKKVTLTENLNTPLVFHVMSWNHLFTQETNNRNSEVVKLNPEYFSKKLWDEYEMIKDKKDIFKKNRAHFDYEEDWVN